MDPVELARSARHLVVFELAARHASFTAAARELDVSQQAVSRSVRELEASLGTRLFVRGHQRLEPTPAGALLQRGVSSGLAAIVEAMRQVEVRTRSQVTIRTTTSIAGHWLLHRLPELRARRPEIDLVFAIDEHDLVLTEHQSTLGLRWGDGAWPGNVSIRICDEEIFPVASPALARHLGPDDANELLAEQRLIHTDRTSLHTISWPEWFAQTGTRYRDDGSGLRFDNYATVLQAAVAGEGIALGWGLVVNPLIAQGHLARIGERSWRTGRGLYLISSDWNTLTPNARAVRDWIVSESAASPRE